MKIDTILALSEANIEKLHSLNWFVGAIAGAVVLVLMAKHRGEGLSHLVFLAGALVAVLFAFYFLATDTSLFPLPRS